MQDRIFSTGAIDCDIHPNVPSLKALLPYLDDHWRDTVIARGMDELNSISYPANAPLTARADWRPDSGKPAATLAQVQRDYLDVFAVSTAICNPLYGVQLLFSEDMAAAFARAVNRWSALTPALSAGATILFTIARWVYRTPAATLLRQ